MEIRLVSTDRDLSTLCAQILAEVTQDHPLSFSTAANFCSAEAPSPNLYIWDFDTHVPLTEEMSSKHSNIIVLAQRADVPQVKRVLGFDPPIILKPANRSTLAALLSFAISSCTAPSLREDRDRMFQALLQANLKLQEFDQNRTNFLMQLVHDFRVPLTALSGYCGLLMSEPLGPLNENQKEVIQRMDYSAKRLARMASAMLQLNLDPQRQRRPDLQNGDLQRATDQALHEIKLFADDKRLAIRSECTPSNGDLYFEPEQIDQVLVNILENACKFTPRDGSIQIHGYPFFWERRSGQGATLLQRERRTCDTREPNSYRLDISNSGPALTQERLENVFEEFTSYSGGSRRSAGGLGLAICRMIINQHSGRVWAENTDTGPMFSFVLPTRQSGSAVGKPPQLA